MTAQKDSEGIANIKGCYVWCIIRITRDVGTQEDWVEAIKAEYPHLTNPDINEAWEYYNLHQHEIEKLIKESHEADGTAQKGRDLRERRLNEVLKALELVREAVFQIKRDGAHPGAIYLGRKFSWYLSRHSVADALDRDFDPDMPDELFGVPVIRVGERTFVISTCAFTRCIFADDDIEEPRKLMEMDG